MICWQIRWEWLLHLFFVICHDIVALMFCQCHRNETQFSENLLSSIFLGFFLNLNEFLPIFSHSVSVIILSALAWIRQWFSFIFLFHCFRKSIYSHHIDPTKSTIKSIFSVFSFIFLFHRFDDSQKCFFSEQFNRWRQNKKKLTLAHRYTHIRPSDFCFRFEPVDCVVFSSICRLQKRQKWIYFCDIFFYVC